MTTKLGIAGVGAIGSAVAKALLLGLEGLELYAISDPAPKIGFGVPNLDFETLVQECDLIIEALPAEHVPAIAEKAFAAQKDLILITSAAFLIYPQIVDMHKTSSSKLYIPSGALAGIDGVKAMKEMGIESATISSTKHPQGFAQAPYIIQEQIDLNSIAQKTKLFEGNAFDAAKGFPANVNVAATLSLAGIGPDKTQVEIWADPNATGNAHEITVKSQYSTLTSRIENMPDPQNPKSSVLAAQSIVTTLRDMHSAIIIA